MSYRWFEVVFPCRARRHFSPGMRERSLVQQCACWSYSASCLSCLTPASFFPSSEKSGDSETGRIYPQQYSDWNQSLMIILCWCSDTSPWTATGIYPSSSLLPTRAFRTVPFPFSTSPSSSLSCPLLSTLAINYLNLHVIELVLHPEVAFSLLRPCILLVD